MKQAFSKQATDHIPTTQPLIAVIVTERLKRKLEGSTNKARPASPPGHSVLTEQAPRLVTAAISAAYTNALARPRFASAPAKIWPTFTKNIIRNIAVIIVINISSVIIIVNISTVIIIINISNVIIINISTEIIIFNISIALSLLTSAVLLPLLQLISLSNNCYSY